MAGSNSTNKNLKFYQLKAKADETSTPHFALSEKVNDKWEVTQKFDTMTGQLCSAEIKEKEFKGAKSNIFVLVVEDGEETSKIEMTHNNVTYSIINALASDCNKLSTYSIAVTKKKSQDGKLYFGNAWLKIDGVDLKWAFSPDTAPKKEPVLVDGKPFIQNGQAVKDDSKLRAFYEGVFTDKIVSKLSVSKPTSVSHETIQNTNPDNDDLPF